MIKSKMYYWMHHLAWSHVGPWASYAYGFIDAYEQLPHDSSRASFPHRYDVGYESGAKDWEVNNYVPPSGPES